MPMHVSDNHSLRLHVSRRMLDGDQPILFIKTSEDHAVCMVIEADGNARLVRPARRRKGVLFMPDYVPLTAASAVLENPFEQPLSEVVRFFEKQVDRLGRRRSKGQASEAA